MPEGSLGAGQQTFHERLSQGAPWFRQYLSWAGPGGRGLKGPCIRVEHVLYRSIALGMMSLVRTSCTSVLQYKLHQQRGRGCRGHDVAVIDKE